MSFLISFSLKALALYLCCYIVLWGICFLPPKIKYVDRLHMGARGLALPGLVLLRYGETKMSLKHELTHIQQYRRYSPLGVALILGWHYGYGFYRQWRAGRSFNFWTLWAKNPLEIEANKIMYSTAEPLQLQKNHLLAFLASTVGVILFMLSL